jgi:membrane protein implicated in regulation of membrane protease activity
VSRTRIVFFIILALYITIIAVTLATNLAGVRFLRVLFIGSTVFSAGVILLDFLGIFGEHHGDTAGDVTAGHIDGVVGHVGHDADAGDAAHGETADHAASDDGHEGEGSAQHNHAAATPILSVLTYLRLFVYFCMGSGPVGWIALATGRSPLTSLLMGAAVGVLAVFLAQAFFRFQRHDTDSQLRAPELVGRHATVIVPLDDKTMGKVRIQVGLMVTEQYALAARSGASFSSGAEVLVTSVTDECIYVR